MLKNFIDKFAGVTQLIIDNREYFHLGRLFNSIKLFGVHKKYYLQASNRFSLTNHECLGSESVSNLKSRGYFFKNKVLDDMVINRLLTNLDERSARYEFRGIQKNELMPDADTAILPDYKVIAVPSSGNGVAELLNAIYQPLVKPIEAANNCYMRPISVWIYRTYGRSPSSLEAGGDYGSFKFHFDNSGIFKTFKVMCLLSDVDDVGAGPFQIAEGSHRLTKYFLPAIGGSRIPDSLISGYVVANCYGKKGDGISFDVKAVHRGGRTTKGTRDVVTVELVPSFIPYDEYISRFQLQGGDHIRGSAYSALREDPYLNS